MRQSWQEDRINAEADRLIGTTTITTADNDQLYRLNSWLVFNIVVAQYEVPLAFPDYIAMQLS